MIHLNVGEREKVSEVERDEDFLDLFSFSSQDPFLGFFVFLEEILRVENDAIIV